MDNQPDPRSKYINDLERDLAKAAAANEFVNSKGGQLVLDWLTQQITVNTNALISNKYVNDHNGYLDARAKVAFASNLTSMLNKLASPDVEAALRGRIAEANSDVE